MTNSFRILSCSVILLLTMPVWAMSPRPQETVPLWDALAPPAQPESSPPASEPWVLLEQTIFFRPAVLTMLRDSSRPLGDVFAVRLPGKPEVEMTVTSRRSGPRGSTIVEGQIGGPDQGNVLLSILEDAVAGTLFLRRERWSIEPRPDHRHRLVQVDAERYPPD